MPTCANQVTNLDGTISLVLVPSQTDLSQCSYAVLSGSEAATGQLLQLTPNDALTILPYVGVVLAIAWGWKQLLNMIKDGVNYDV